MATGDDGHEHRQNRAGRRRQIACRTIRGRLFARIEMATTYILTAEMDEDSFGWLDRLRRRYFPPERNFLPAHLTLFHLLSPDQVARLRSLEWPGEAIVVRFDRVVFLGFGVAFHVQSVGLDQLREQARARMGGEFSRQDSQPWKPHVTVQNKASAEAARELQRTLEQDFSARVGSVTGLLVWEYLGGPWKLAERIAFGTSEPPPQADLRST
jgi:2'-5' RNA ligase superfamily